MDNKPVVYVVFDVSGKRYKVSVRPSKTHSSLADVTVQTLLKNMAGIVKESIDALQLYDPTSGATLLDADRLTVGGTVNLRKLDTKVPVLSRTASAKQQQQATPPVSRTVSGQSPPPVTSTPVSRSTSHQQESNIIEAAVQQAAASRSHSNVPAPTSRTTSQVSAPNHLPPVAPPRPAVVDTPRAPPSSRGSSVDSLHPPAEIASSRFAPTGRGASSSRQSSVNSTYREDAVVEEAPVWRRGAGDVVAAMPSEILRNDGNDSENSEELRYKCNELSMMKDRLAQELAQLTARIETHSSQRRGRRGISSDQPSSHFQHQSPLNSMSPSRRYARDAEPSTHQVLSTYRPISQPRHEDPEVVVDTREEDEADMEIRSLEQNIASLNNLMEDGASEWASRRKELQRRVKEAKDMRIRSIKAELIAAAQDGREVEEQRQAMEEELAMVARRLASSNMEADERKVSVDDATAKLDAIKEEIRRIIRSEGGEEEQLAQGIVATAAQCCKTKQAHGKEEESNKELKATFEELSLERKHLHSELEDAKGNIRVIVRLRPKLSSDDLAPQAQGSLEDGALDLDTKQKCVYVTTPTTGSRRYELYDVYGPTRDSIQQQGALFDEQVAPLLNSVFDGFNVAVLAYGQTGSGKTFTIVGETSEGTLSGLLPQSVEYLMHEMQARKRHQQVTISLTMTELYLDTVYDLLHTLSPSEDAADPDAQRGGIDRNRKCEIRQAPGMDGVVVSGAVEVELENWEHAMQIIHAGIDERQTHRTAKNSQSSRSHLILTLWVEMVTARGLQKSKLVFCDLAGSERVSRSLSSGDRLKEAQHINKSLSSLGDILHALSTTPRPQHIPYRNSKLTQLLQNTLGGNSKTLMVACISPHIPAQHNLVETQSTLQFASRARLIRNQISQAHASHQNQSYSTNTGGY